MKKVGYISQTSQATYIKEQIEFLNKANVDEIKNESNHEIMDLQDVVAELGPKDVLVVYELRSLGKSVIQLADFLNELKEKSIILNVLKKGEAYNDIDDQSYLEMVLKIAEMEKLIIRERTTKGLQEARRKGRIGGRPKISEETIEQIRFLYNNNRYTLRQIAEECNISLGTAYKYVQEK